MTNEADLVGSWSLISFEVTLDKGTMVAPFGPDPIGRLVYTAGGRMSAHLMARQRDIPKDAPVADRALAAMRQHFSYAGAFHVDGPRVVHTVDMAISPDWIGEEKRRIIEWVDDDLILTEERSRVGRDFGKGRLRWRREE